MWFQWFQRPFRQLIVVPGEAAGRLFLVPGLPKSAARRHVASKTQGITLLQVSMAPALSRCSPHVHHQPLPLALHACLQSCHLGQLHTHALAPAATRLSRTTA